MTESSEREFPIDMVLYRWRALQIVSMALEVCVDFYKNVELNTINIVYLAYCKS